jgi:heme-degrading monooxygenase HmoA
MAAIQLQCGERFTLLQEGEDPVEGKNTYVAVSEIAVPVAGAPALESAFRDRMGAVDAWPGFLGLEVLQDRRKAGRYLMICRWESREQFLAYMRSDDHRRSHARIPQGPAAPSPAGFSEYTLVSE